MFLAGTKSGNVGKLTLDSNKVDCVDDVECCLLCPGRGKGCKVEIFVKRRIFRVLNKNGKEMFSPMFVSVMRATVAWVSIPFPKTLQTQLTRTFLDPKKHNHLKYLHIVHEGDAPSVITGKTNNWITLLGTIDPLLKRENQLF